MATVQAFFDRMKGKDVAARLSPAPGYHGTYDLFYYVGDATGRIPPAVYLEQGMEESREPVYKKILVNYDLTGSWIVRNSEVAIPFAAQATDVYDQVVQIKAPKMSHWNPFSLKGLGPKPNLSSIYGSKVSYGESRARRVYMLATFCLIKRMGYVGKTSERKANSGHNIGAILVSRDGEVLAWGVNTGGYRHAEVNTLISYFLRNKGAKTLPEGAVLFSSLKPCDMCSTFIKESWNGGEAQVWYGMMDEGGSGSSPVLGDKASAFTPGDTDLDAFDLLAEGGTLDTAIKTTGTKPVLVHKDGKKVDLTQSLDKSGMDPSGKNQRLKPKASGAGFTRLSAADWVDYSDEVYKLIEAAAAKFQAKADKTGRDDGAMKRVLDHLKGFVFAK